ncbi:MAG: mevalonate kinase [Candidatus Aenigmatarchaeota archaeon]
MTKKVGKGFGYGKVILFGEHFVVYGVPGIASGIKKYVKVKVEEYKDGILFHDRIFNCDVYFDKSYEHPHCKTFAKILDYFEVKNAKITITGDVIPMAGMGYSAALAVAVIRGLSKFTGKRISNEEVNRLAYECEKISHTNPSGIDNTCATYGKIIWFQKNMKGGKNIIEPIQINGKILLVMGYSGKMGSTKELVEKVRMNKEREPKKYDEIFSKAENLVKEARKKLISFDLRELGKLMDENHSLLRKIEVSCYELDKLCEIAKENGALGAKLTGSGGGGFMIALAENKNVQEKIMKAIEENGYKAIKIEIGN